MPWTRTTDSVCASFGSVINSPAPNPYQKSLNLSYIYVYIHIYIHIYVCIIYYVYTHPYQIHTIHTVYNNMKNNIVIKCTPGITLAEINPVIVIKLLGF